MVWRGTARYGVAGSVRRGMARQGEVRFGEAGYQHWRYKMKILILVSLLFTGCASFGNPKPSVIRGNAASVVISINHAGGTVSKTQVFAEKYCKQYSKVAVYDRMIENRGWTVKHHQWLCT